MATRTYSSERRAAGAAQTRADVLESARALFMQHGYAAVTVPRIAARAGVSVATVYSAVGGKVQLFVALFDAAAGDPAVDEAMQRVTSAPTSAEVLRALGHGTRLVSERHRWMLTEMYDNAGGDPLIAERLAGAQDDLRGRFTQAARRIHELDGAGSDDVDRVVTTLLFFFGVAAWRTLRDEDWDWDDAEQWLVGRASEALSS
ncbi:TetR/AcrR family transcriptional regulator [Curtobacterium sp. L1-20]|uniref:TetR/AcrR family transcriptional regulator n=1 Tax=Curtobacterium sp. L1-20 TaxID=3138181 RepID=UPI003B527592